MRSAQPPCLMIVCREWQGASCAFSPLQCLRTHRRRKKPPFGGSRNCSIEAVSNKGAGNWVVFNQQSLHGVPVRSLPMDTSRAQEWSSVKTALHTGNGIFAFAALARVSTKKKLERKKNPVGRISPLWSSRSFDHISHRAKPSFVIQGLK